MSEDQASIEAWRTATFGPHLGTHATARITARANLEMAELVDAVARGESFDKIGLECADVLIVLYGVASSIGLDLHAAVNEKMKINRKREWTSEGGTRHVSPLAKALAGGLAPKKKR